MKIEIEISDECEATSSPWWMIVDPEQNFHKGNQGVSNIAHMITGPFFSREAAQAELTNRNYDYGASARVWCASGYHAKQYHDKVEAERRAIKRGDK